MTDAAGDASGIRDRLDSVLRDLYDFGDDFATSKTNICENRQHAGHTVEKETEKVSESEEEQPTAVCTKRGKKRVSLFFESIKDELRSQPKSADFPGSSASEHQVEVVTFARRKKQTKGTEIKGRDSEMDVGAAEEVNSETFNFEKARLEVHKFGITGYKKEKQRKFEQERAIMLGAKPPKREYVNYKVYQKKIKEQVQSQKEKSLKENGLEPVKKKRKPGQNGRSTRKPKGSAVVPSGQVGRFRNGALILSGKDIQKIKQSRVIK